MQGTIIGRSRTGTQKAQEQLEVSERERERLRVDLQASDAYCTQSFAQHAVLNRAPTSTPKTGLIPDTLDSAQAFSSDGCANLFSCVCFSLVIVDG